MRNLTTLAVDAFAQSEGWHAVAPDTEARDAVYVARAVHGHDTSLVRLTLARLSHTAHEELASLAVVAVGGAVIPHDRWSDTALREGDVVDVLTAIQGG